MIIYNPGGGKVLEIEVDDHSYRYRAVKGENSLTLYYSLDKHVEIPVGSFCTFQAEQYTLERPEAFKMKHSRLFEYTVILESPAAKAGKWKFRNTVDGRLKFPLTAKPIEHLRMFVDNMNNRDSGWTVGACVDGNEILVNYDHVYCDEALALMASELKTEFEYRGKTVSLRKVEYNKNNPLPLSYGRGNGFKPGVGRSNYGDKPPIEILYVQGGTANIDPSRYGNRELLLPKNQMISYDGEYFEDDPGFNADNARRYVVDDLGLSVRRSDKQLSSLTEDSLDCSDISPRRVGDVTGVAIDPNNANFYDIMDDSIPEALNYSDCLIAGETMTIIFQSGMLAGREFEVKYYHNYNEKVGDVEVTKRGKFEIVPQEIDGQTMPNATFAPKVGDKYAVFNCMLPDAYICNNEEKNGASWDIFRAGVRYLFDNEESQFSFTGELDGIWAKKDWVNIGGKIQLGGYVSFTDERFQQEGVLVRIIGIKDYINNPHSPEIELSNSPVSGSFSTTINQIQSDEVLMENYHREALQFTKRRFRDAKEAISMLEDSLLNFSGSINPITVQTMLMLIGDESLQFRFVNSMTNPVRVTHNVTYDQKTKQLTSPAGIIQHMTIGISSLKNEHKADEYKFWNLPKYISAVLDDEAKKYYLYAKVSKTNQTGAFILSDTAIGMEDVAGYYHLLMGILNSEYEGERSFVTLYGFTEILPGRITTDLIASSDGKMYIDLINKIICGRVRFLSNGEETDLEDWAQDTDDGIQDALSAAEAVSDNVSDLGSYIDNAFKDGVINAAEAKAIEKYLNTLNESMAKAEASYNKVYANSYLEGAAKTALLNAKINLWGQRDTLLSAINTAISGGTTTPAQKTAVDNAFNSFNSLMQAFQSALEEANKAIQAKLDAISKGYVDDLQIGGTNLFSKSVFPDAGRSGVTGYDYEKEDYQNGFKITGGNNGRSGYIKFPGVIKGNGEYTFSFIMRGTQDRSIGCKVNICGKVSPLLLSTNNNKYGKALSFTAVVGNYEEGVNDYIQIEYLDWMYYRFDNLKLEEGGKATTYSPSPEDFRTEIDKSRQEAEAAAKAYAEVQAEAARITAEAHADGKVSDEEAERIKDVNAKLAAAKAYAEAQDALLKKQQEAYADGVATAAEQAAINVAKAQAELAKAYAEAYADGKVSDEEAARIADAEAKLKEAKDYASSIGTSSGGKMLYKDPTFKTGVNSSSKYANAGGGNVTWARIAKPSDAPTDSGYIMRHTYTPGSPATSPGFGGFVQSTNSRANAVFVHKIIAKIPVGKSIYHATNATGNGRVIEWLTPRAGTGKYETYMYKHTCGVGGTFSSFGYVYFEGGANEAFTVDVAYATIFDMSLYDDTADKAAAIAADAQAKANISKAVTDNFTSIDGGLITTTIIQLRPSTDAPITAGMSAIQGANNVSPALWAGGTYAQAIAGTAKAIIRHNGTSKFTDTEIEGKITAVTGSLGTLTMQVGGYIDLPPTFASRKGRLDNTGLSLVYDGANSQKIEWYSGLGTFAGQITCNSQGRLKLSSSFGVGIGLDFYGDAITITPSSLFSNAINFNASDVSNMKQLTGLGILNFANSYMTLNNNSDYSLFIDVSCLIVNPQGSEVHISNIKRGTQSSPVNPVNGDVLFIVNASTSYNVDLRTTGNIRYRASYFTLDENDSCMLVYYGGYWRPHMDKGQ